MRKSLILLAAMVLSAPLFCITALGREPSRFSCSTAVGTGFGLGRPSSTPFVWRITGYYNPGRRFSVGAGTGLSFYEKALVPLYADAKFLFARPRRFTPYAEFAAGYAFALRGDADGGLMLGPAVGVQYALRTGMHLFFSAGYELQKLERLREYRGDWFSAGFCEKLSHGTLLFQVGVLF